MKAKAILEMEEYLETTKEEASMVWQVPKDIKVVRAHIEELVRKEFSINQSKWNGEGAKPHKVREAIRLSELPPLPVAQPINIADAIKSTKFLCAVNEYDVSEPHFQPQYDSNPCEIVALVAPNEPIESSDLDHSHFNMWPDMIVRFRLTNDCVAGTGEGGAPALQASTRTNIEAMHMSGQTIDAWNVFTHNLKSKLVQKSSDEIKRDMLVNTADLLDSLKKAIENPELMTNDDVDGLSAHIACMMAYTQAVEKGDSEKDPIRNAVGDFHKLFNTAWSLRGIPDDCPDWRLEPLKDTSKGGLLMQKEHRQQLVQFVREEGRKKFDPDQYALQYNHQEIKQAVAAKAQENAATLKSLTP